MLTFERRQSNPIATVVHLIIFVMLVMAGLHFLVKCVVEEQENASVFGMSQTEGYYYFYKHHGSPVPWVMAHAVEVVKPVNRPRIAGVSIAESHGTPWAVGDNGESRGAFQVQEKHWGKVPISAVDQALQAERILEELVASEPPGGHFDVLWLDIMAERNLLKELTDTQTM